MTHRDKERKSRLYIRIVKGASRNFPKTALRTSLAHSKLLKRSATSPDVMPRSSLPLEPPASALGNKLQVLAALDPNKLVLLEVMVDVWLGDTFGHEPRFTDWYSQS